MAIRSLSLREKRLIQAAILLVIIILVSLLLRGGGSDASGPAAPLTSPAPATAPAPVAPAPAPVTPSADLTQLRLHGLLASGAVISSASGGQRLIPVGREVVPGLTLVRIEQNHAIVQGAGGEVRLGFDGVAQPDPSAAAESSLAAAGPAGQREERLRYRLGLAPRTTNGRVTGYTVRGNIEMPALARAGIRPGDVITGVNGSVLNEEQLQELAWTIANSSETRFEVERGGRQLQLTLPR